MNKYIVTIMLSISSASMLALDVTALQNEAAGAVQTVKQLEPQIREIINSIAQGNFDFVRTPLSQINVNTTIDTINDLLAQLQQNLPAIVEKIPVDMIPSQYKGVAQDIIQQIKNNPQYLSQARAQLATLKQFINANGTIKTGDIDAIVNALNEIKNTNEFNNVIKPALVQLWANKLEPIYSWINQQDRIQSIQNALAFVVAKINDSSTQASLQDVSNLAVMFGLLRRIIGIVSGVTQATANIVQGFENSAAKNYFGADNFNTVKQAVNDVNAQTGTVEAQLNNLVDQLKSVLQ